MIYQLYSIKDTKSGNFMNIWTSNTDAERKRNFSRAKQQPDSIINMFPTDFELWRLGEFDSNTGLIKNEVKYIEGGAINE